MINKHKSNKIKENSNTVRHWNNGTDHRHSKSCCDKSSPARRTITPPFRQNNVAMTFGVIMTLLLRHLYVVIYIYHVLHVAPYAHNSNMSFCINNNHLNKSNLTFAHGKSIGLLAMIMLLHNALLILFLLS